MTNELSLKELMSPTRMELQARFNNAQIAVDMAYRISDKHTYIPDVKVINPDWKEGDPLHQKYDYIEASMTEKINKIVEVARMLKVEIEKDLNDTLKVLEVVDNGAKTDAPKLP